MAEAFLFRVNLLIFFIVLAGELALLRNLYLYIEKKVILTAQKHLHFSRNDGLSWVER